MNGSEAVEALARVLPAGAISTDEDDLMSHARDWSPFSLLQERAGGPMVLPRCVVRPADTSEVAAVLRWAHATATPVVPFGGGSGVCRAIAPDPATVVIDLCRLDSIGPVDDVGRLVTVQAGATGPALTGRLASEGWFLGHEPQSLAISTVGGWVATKACGQLSAGFGGIEDLIAGLEAVLPTGEVVRSKTTPRRVAGPDVAALMIGSEGTLGVVTEVTLRVSPPPGRRANRCVRFEHMADGVAACRRIAQSALHPDVVRLYDREDASIFLMGHPDETQGPLLLLSFSGEGAELRADDAASMARGTAGNKALVEHWWGHRNDAVETFRRVMAGQGLLGPHGVVDTFEVAGTWSGLRELYHGLKTELGVVADLVGCHLSHVYRDGACLYFTMASATQDDETARTTLERWWQVGLNECIDKGGAISHHHGIGRVKASHLQDELGGWWPVLKAVKSAIDPKGIMNPGALGL